MNRLSFRAVTISAALLGSAAAQGAELSPDPWALPVFARPLPEAVGVASRWEGSFARVSAGFEASSSRHFGSYAGPTIGFEGGRMWRDGDLVYGVVGGFDHLTITSGGEPRFGQIAYTRDFAGAIQFKAGKLVTEDVLLYAKVGGSLVNGSWRFGPTSATPGFSRNDLELRPDGRVGVEWAVTDRTSISLEAGVSGRSLR